ncbi:MAG: hypothetical protein ACLFR6_04300 [Salinarchaeum sp.]
MSLYAKALGSTDSGQRLGSHPCKEALREEIQRLHRHGMDAQAIGQRIGVYYMNEGETETLDKLETVLTEEFEDYGR